MQKAKVAVFGCGSVGAPVATMLAEAGVGHLLLVDKDTLAAANVGRHPLGIDALGRHKSEALALLLRKCYPHLCIDYEVSSVEDLLLSNSKQIEGVDLIVSALGSWPAEALLDQWHSSSAAPPAIVYGWTEPHAAAGQAVVLKGDGARLRDGLDETGTPLLQVTEWSEDMNLRAEPACGAFFQPYGPIEVGYINNMIGELCLDVLLDQVDDATHRIWAARDSLLASAGGQWTERWTSIMNEERGRQGGIFERRWAAETLRAN
nr:ThiF family adenylyltransferase [Methylosinus sp. RM1]